MFSQLNNPEPPAQPHRVYGCAHADPERRLVAAVVLQAVKDAYFPRQSTSGVCIADAKQFLASDTGREMLLAALGKK